MGKRVLLLLLVLVMVMCWESQRRGQCEAAYTGHKLLLVSMDGFRWDYIHNISGLHNFRRLQNSSCSVQHVEPVFITKTYPCHYGIVTGLYAESSGIVANHMYDRARNATFSYRSAEEFWWKGGEPVWITAEKHNISTATYFWPGSEAQIDGYRPSMYEKYNGSVPFPERVVTALSWLADQDKDFVALYFHEPDMTGHFFGPHSQQMIDKVREMDGILGQILQGLDNKNLSDSVNIIVTSDHGMAEISMQDKLIDLWDYVNKSWVERVPDYGPTTAVLPVEGREEDVLQAARNIPNATAYRKEDVPEHFHYSHNPRIMPIIIIADEGWTVSTNVTKSRAADDKGNHGYSNRLSSMKPIFFARGPDFRTGVQKLTIRSVDIYPLLCRLLGLTPLPNNGSAKATEDFLVDRGPSSFAAPLAGCTCWLLLFLATTTTTTLLTWMAVPFP